MELIASSPAAIVNIQNGRKVSGRKGLFHFGHKVEFENNGYSLADSSIKIEHINN